MTELDIREMPPRDRHPAIFRVLDGLSPGETLRIINDHDPVPLRYQLDAERPHHFVWVPVEEGPQRWVIDITSCVHRIDVRPTIASGGEPFGQIMDVVSRVGDAEVLALSAPFDPVPLKAVMAERGFLNVTRSLDDGSWEITFFRPPAGG